MAGVMKESLKLDDFSRWKVDDLKKFIKERGHKTTYRVKRELVAVAFALYQQQLPVVASNVDGLQQVDVDYQTLLRIEWNGVTYTLPDPNQLQEGWLPESTGVTNWPPCSYVNISAYLVDHDQRALLSRLANDYKEGKAFSYFASQQAWIKDVCYNGLSDESPFCVLKSECMPSQRIREIPHKLWSIIEKKTGAVRSAYCSCFAGLGSTCNHVGALLFKLDYAWQQGLTSKKPCTSTTNQWLAPSVKSVEPVAAKDMVIRKPRFHRQTTAAQERSADRRLFNPLSLSRTKATNSLDKLVHELYAECPDAAVFQYSLPLNVPQYEPECDVNVGRYESCPTTPSLPLPLFTYSKAFSSVEQLMANLQPLSIEQQALVERETVQQSDCPEWFAHRRARISASIAYEINSYVVKAALTKSSKCNKTGDRLASLIIEPPPPLLNVASLQYGRATEPVAVEAYLMLEQSRHSNLRVTKCGLFIDRATVYLCASPDRLVYCDCCGDGLLEVKCPISCMAEDPKHSGLPYLQNENDMVSLKSNHKYYAQVQMQMAVVGRNWCDFFVYTQAGFHLERVAFNPAYWDSLKANCSESFSSSIAPKLIAKHGAVP